MSECELRLDIFQKERQEAAGFEELVRAMRRAQDEGHGYATDLQNEVDEHLAKRERDYLDSLMAQFGEV